MNMKIGRCIKMSAEKHVALLTFLIIRASYLYFQISTYIFQKNTRMNVDNVIHKGKIYIIGVKGKYDPPSAERGAC